MEISKTAANSNLVFMGNIFPRERRTLQQIYSILPSMIKVKVSDMNRRADICTIYVNHNVHVYIYIKPKCISQCENAIIFAK